MTPKTIDEVLCEVVGKNLRGQLADAVLELRESALARRDAGDCVSCYFKILGASSRSGNITLSPLRRWLEAQLEVVAHAPGVGELEKLPISLDSSDLEHFCQEMMSRVHNDRGYQHPRIELYLNFRETSRVA